MAAQIGIVIIGADPDKRFTQCHVAQGTVDPGNILKEIIDVTVNDLPASIIFLIAQALACKELNVVVHNRRSKSFCVVDMNK